MPLILSPVDVPDGKFIIKRVAKNPLDGTEYTEGSEADGARS